MATDVEYKKKREQLMRNPAPVQKPGYESPLMKYSPKHGQAARAKIGVTESAYAGGALAKNVYSPEERNYMKSTGFMARGGGAIPGGTRDIGGVLEKKKRQEFEDRQAFQSARREIASTLGLDSAEGKAAYTDLMKGTTDMRSGRQQSASDLMLEQERAKSELALETRRNAVDLALGDQRSETQLATQRMAELGQTGRQAQSDAAAMGRLKFGEESDAAVREEAEARNKAFISAYTQYGKDDPTVRAEMLTRGIDPGKKDVDPYAAPNFMEFFKVRSQANPNITPANAQKEYEALYGTSPQRSREADAARDAGKPDFSGDKTKKTPGATSEAAKKANSGLSVRMKAGKAKTVWTPESERYQGEGGRKSIHKTIKEKIGMKSPTSQGGVSGVGKSGQESKIGSELRALKNRGQAAAGPPDGFQTPGGTPVEAGYVPAPERRGPAEQVLQGKTVMQAARDRLNKVRHNPSLRFFRFGL